MKKSPVIDTTVTVDSWLYYFSQFLSVPLSTGCAIKLNIKLVWESTFYLIIVKSLNYLSKHINIYSLPI